MDSAKTLKDIVAFTSKVEELLIESQGEITEEIANYLIVKEVNLPEKVDGYAEFIDRIEIAKSYFKKRSDDSLKISKALDKVSTGLEFNIENAMRTLNVESLKGNDYLFSFKNNPPSVVIDNEDLIEDSYKEVVTETVIRKKKIADDLKLGVPVAGARLESKQTLKKSLNTPTKKEKK